MENNLLPPLYKLTTIDNPFHPVDERDQWERFDLDHGYNTDALVEKLSGFSDDMTEAEIRRAENDVMDDLVRLDLECKYRKVLIEE